MRKITQSHSARTTMSRHSAAGRLLLMTLLLLAAFGVVNAQQIILIGTDSNTSSSGSGTSSATNYGAGSPMGNTYYYYSTAQFIYLASELGSAKTINSLAFYQGKTGSFVGTINIYLMHTSSSTVSTSNPATSGTLVYTGTDISIGSDSNGWQTFTLDTPFEYNGTDNLMVMVCRTKASSGSPTYHSTQGWCYTTYSDSYRFMQRSSDTSGYDEISNISYSYTESYYRPNIQIGVTTTEPYINLDPYSATVFTGLTETLMATYGNVTGTPTITYSSSNNNVATVSGNGNTVTVTAVAPGTATITATMNYEGETYTATCAITVEAPSYCEPSFSTPSDDHISNFATTGGITNISNTSTYESSGYSDYYSTLSASIEAGETLSFRVTPSSTQWSYGHAIWVDWNNDYEFSSDEKVAYTTSPATGNWSGSFTVPDNIPAGDYHLRVIHFYNNTPTDACMSGQYGEAEDYKLTVLTPGAYTITCATTTGGTILADKTSANENDVVTITAMPETDYLLTALTYTPEGGSAQDIDITSMPYTFTMPAANVTLNATFTLSACPRPTNLTVSNLAASHATVSWDGEAGSYTVQYSTATVTGTTLEPIFEDGFEDGMDDWTIYAGGYDDSAYNWLQYDGSLVDEGNHTGDYVAASRSWSNSNGDQSVDNWLVTPQMTLGDVVKFWVACNDGYRDSYAVYVSTGSNVVTSSSSIGDFVLVKSYAEATGTWTEIPIDISAYAGQQGYVAIRHTNYGGDHILVDDFGVYNTFNTYSYGGWTTVSPTPTTNSCQLTGLSAETLYEVQVQANYGGTDGSSAWSSVRFTTPDNCGAPQELASSDITATSATLSWADDKDSYNLQYRKVYYYEDFEGSDGIPTGWTTINNSTTAGSLNWQVLHLNNHSGNNSVGSGSYIYQNTGITPDNWFISPLLDLQGTLRVWLSGYGERNEEHFEILLSTTGTSVSDFTTTLVAESTTTNSYGEYTADLSSYAGQKGYIAIHHFNCSDQNYLCVDDFGLYGSENWVTLSPNPTTETANLTGLTPNTEYEWQVQGVNCDGNGGTTEWSEVSTFTTLPLIELANDDSQMEAGNKNTAIIAANAGNPVNVQLADRTLYKDGEWNTICLPFNVTIEDSPLAGATVMELNEASMDGAHVTLNFVGVEDELEAGKPYIIMWEDDGTDNIVSPVFNGVTILNSTIEDRTISRADGNVKFIGYYDAFDITSDNDNIYYLTSGSTFKHTATGRTLYACRAYFEFSEAAKARQFILNFGENGGTTTGIVEIEDGTSNTGDSTYDLLGRKVDGKQSTINGQLRKGLYIKNGHKVVIK